jgi:hypothetical protein
MRETPPCTICHSGQTYFLFEGWDLMYGYPDSAFVYQCRDCDHVFVADAYCRHVWCQRYKPHYFGKEIIQCPY